ncbi:MAG TPA: hypothetical protein VFR95_07435 [Gemmatimonadaceae bacterium]|nr:hypothetical protein [Gemmatimonadaceae bacterium]
MMPAQQSSSRAATLRLIGTTVAVTLVVVLVAVELATMGDRARSAVPPTGSPGAVSAQSADAPPIDDPASEPLDRGNAAYRAGNYAGALDAYRAAAVAAPEDAAPYFGIYMAAMALHDTVLADSAMRVIRAQHASGGDMLTDSSLRDLHAHGAMVPKGHPPIPGRSTP